MVAHILRAGRIAAFRHAALCAPALFDRRDAAAPRHPQRTGRPQCTVTARAVPAAHTHAPAPPPSRHEQLWLSLATCFGGLCFSNRSWAVEMLTLNMETGARAEAPQHVWDEVRSPAAARGPSGRVSRVPLLRASLARLHAGAGRPRSCSRAGLTRQRRPPVRV